MRVVLSIVFAIGAYLLGGFSTGMWVSSKYSVKDIRKHGSGSSGATNVLRVLGLKPGLTTFAGDFLKGLAAALLGRLLSGLMGIDPRQGASLLGICAVLGHVFPIQSGFRGGKGVATCGGVFLAVTPFIGIMSMAAAIVSIVLTHIISVGSLVGAALYFIITSVSAILTNRIWLLFFALSSTAIVFYAHRENIQRLRSGKESKVEFGKRK